MNMRSWMQGVINDKKRIAIPIMTHPGIELIGKTVLEAVSDGNIHFEAIKALDQKYPSAACMMCLRTLPMPTLKCFMKHWKNIILDNCKM